MIEIFVILLFIGADVTDVSDFLPLLPFDFAEVFVSRDGVGETASSL